MASSNPPIRAAAYTTYVSLVSQADTKLFKTTVTLATGDVTVSKDGGSFANIGTLPAEISTSGVLSVALTGTEMTADTVTVRFRDASGAEWCDLVLVIHTVAANFDSLSGRIPTALVSGRIDASVGAMAADVITAAAHDESTAFPVKSADTGSTQIARVGADSDTLKSLSDQLDAKASQTSVDDVPTNAELATALGTADDATLAAIAALNNLSAAGVRTAVGLATANLDTQLGDLPTNAELATALGTADDAVLTAIGDLPTNAELATALGTADDAILTAIAALNNITVAQILTTAMTEVYAAEGGTLTIAQALHEIVQFLTEKTVSGTTLTVKKRDGTTAATYTLNDADEPTAITRGS